MPPVSHFLHYWVLAFVTLCAAVFLLQVYYRLIDSDLSLHSLAKEAAIAGLASMVEGAGYWFSALLFAGDATRRLVIPGVIVGIIYKLGHFEEWSGYEIGGIVLFQMVLSMTGAAMPAGQFKLALIVLGVFAIALTVVASVAKNL